MKKFHVGSILLGIVLLILLIWKIGVDALWRDLSLLGWGLVPFVLIEGIAGLFYTLGWRFCLSPSHQSLPFLRLWSINLAGNSINYFTPTATLGGEVTKGTLLSADHRGAEAATGVIVGKLSYALSQLLFVVLGSILLLGKFRLPAGGSIIMLAGSTLLGAGNRGVPGRSKTWPPGGRGALVGRSPSGGRTLQKAAHQITQVDQALKLFYLERPRDLPLSMLWHTAGMACSIVNTWYFLLLLTDGSFIAAAGIWFLGTWFDLLAFAIPLGIGVQEGTRMLAFKALGFSLTLGLTYGIALRLQQLFWAGVGLLFYGLLLTGKRSFSQEGSHE